MAADTQTAPSASDANREYHQHHHHRTVDSTRMLDHPSADKTPIQRFPVRTLQDSNVRLPVHRQETPDTL